MSVQAGICHFDHRPVDQDFLQTLGRRAADYGPDGESIYCDPGLGMLYRPLQTTPESVAERQPYSFSCGSRITWDGRLDNRNELMRLLPALPASEPTDLAVVAAAFERWGIDCFPRLSGDWAACIWDQPLNQMVLARDYVGIKQLFYRSGPQSLIWCSHLEPLLISGDPLTICEEYVAGYLAMFPSARLTPYQEIRCVPPGSVIMVHDGTIREHRYWSFAMCKPIRYRTDSEYEEQFRYLFRQAVRRRLRSHRPVLAELSGGIDSSSIVCMADDIVSQGETAAPQVDTISYYDPRVPAADERSFAAHVEQRRGRKGYHINLADPVADYFCLDSDQVPLEPGPSQALNQARLHLLSLLDGPGYRVVLSGLGGDEVLGGVNDPSSHLADLIMLAQPVKLARTLAAWSKAQSRSWRQLLLPALGLLLPSPLRLAPSKNRMRVRKWIDPAFAQRNQLGFRQLGAQGNYGLWLPSRREFARRLIFIWRQLRSQPMLMHHEERRYPFLDQDLVTFLFSIPAGQLLRPGQPRSLMRRALAGIVPSPVLWRNTKGGTSLDFRDSFERNRSALENVLAHSIGGRMGFLDAGRFRERLLKDINTDPDRVIYRSRELFLEVWLHRLVENGVIRAPEKTLIDDVPLAYPQELESSFASQEKRS